MSLSDSDVMRIAQAVVDLLLPKLGARPDLPPVMTLKEVVRCTGMGRTRLLDLIKAEKFPRHFEGGGRGSTKLWRGSDIRRWLEAGDHEKNQREEGGAG
jgi:predicted DNA-binding transcriptional regulator AlpA